MAADSDGEPDRDTAAVDATIRTLVEAGDVDAAATRAIERYGPELHGFATAIARDEDLASEAFAAASEQIWRHLAGYRWEGSLRAWCYQILRNALHHARTDPRRRIDRNLPLSLATGVAHVQRSTTAPYQRTEVKDAMRALRESLDPVDHEILILRLDRAMSWKDIARSLATDDEAPETLDQRAAAYRKRFERAKTQLRELAVQHGLLPGD